MLGASLAITLEKNAPVESLEDILKSRYHVAVPADTALEQMFKMAPVDSLEHQIYSKGLVRAVPETDFPNDFKSLLASGNLENTVSLAVYQQTMLRRTNHHSKGSYPDYPCKLAAVNKNLGLVGTGMVYQKNWPYTKLLNLHMLKLKEDGIIDLLLNKYFNKKDNVLCGPKHTHLPMEIRDTILLFTLLAVGQFISIIVIILECMNHRR